jgi:hypothetical protein
MSVIYEQKSSGMCKAIRAISHMFAHSKKAIRWLIWLVRNLSIIRRVVAVELIHQHWAILTVLQARIDSVSLTWPRRG